MKVLMVGYRCSPYDVSEAYAAFSWLEILLKKYEVILFTTTHQKSDVLKYYNNQLPKTLKIIAFNDNHRFKGSFLINDSIKLGYFIFNYKAKNYVKRNISIFNEVNVLFHKSPMSFRYPSFLSNFDKPFIIGPIGGGVSLPKSLKSYFQNNKIKRLLSEIDPYLLKLKPIKRNFDKADHILITLGYVKEIFDESHIKKMCEICDTGIDTSQFKKFKLDANNNSKVRILFVGRLVKAKGAELLIKAVSKLYYQFQNQRFMVDIVGDGVEYNNLKTLVLEYQLGDVINLVGKVDRNQVKDYYNKADIFCFPTLKEASGNVLLEAMSYSLPIVTINNGGPKYMCPPQGSIKIEPIGEAYIIAAIADALLELINEPELREEMGNFNHEYCVKTFDWNAIEKKIFAIFDEYEKT